MELPHSDQARWFAAEVQPHEPDLRAFLRRRFPTLTDIDDLVQSAYLSVIRARRAGTLAEPRAYLFTSARNAALDFFRRNRTINVGDIAEHPELRVVEEKPDAAESASRAQEIEMLVEAIHTLPERCREVLTLRKLHGLSYREIALRLGISENTVNAQLAIGIVRCRRYLEERGVAGRTADAKSP